MRRHRRLPGEVVRQATSPAPSFSIRTKGELAVGILQHFLDEYLKNNAGEIDYIHDDDALIELCQAA